jgi:hypothetical protein
LHIRAVRRKVRAVPRVSLLPPVLLFFVVSACGAPAAKAEAPASPSQGPDAGSANAAEPVRTAEWPFGPAPSAEETAAQLARLVKEAFPVKSNWVPPGKQNRYGHAEALIPAPYDTVRGRLVDYAHFKELAGPRFSTVRVVGKEERATDVYFILPIMKGLLRLWYVTRFAPPRIGQGGEVFEGSFVKGNIKDMHIVFALRRGADAGTALLTCDLLLSLKIPAPQDNVDEELRDACGDALQAVRQRVTTTARD